METSEWKQTGKCIHMDMRAHTLPDGSIALYSVNCSRLSSSIGNTSAGWGWEREVVCVHADVTCIHSCAFQCIHCVMNAIKRVIFSFLTTKKNTTLSIVTRLRFQLLYHTSGFAIKSNEICLVRRREGRNEDNKDKEGNTLAARKKGGGKGQLEMLNKLSNPACLDLR